MELVCNVADSYNFKMRSYSKKPYHHVEYWAYYFYQSIPAMVELFFRYDWIEATAAAFMSLTGLNS